MSLTMGCCHVSMYKKKKKIAFGAGVGCDEDPKFLFWLSFLLLDKSVSA